MISAAKADHRSVSGPEDQRNGSKPRVNSLQRFMTTVLLSMNRLTRTAERNATRAAKVSARSILWTGPGVGPLATSTIVPFGFARTTAHALKRTLGRSVGEALPSVKRSADGRIISGRQGSRWPGSDLKWDVGIPVHLVNLGILGIRAYFGSCRTHSNAGHSSTVWTCPILQDPHSSHLPTSSPWIRAVADPDRIPKVLYLTESGGRFLWMDQRLFHVRTLKSTEVKG